MAIRVQVLNGWLVVPYDGHDLSRVALATTTMVEPTGSEWKPAFLDWVQGARVAKTRFSGILTPTTLVWMRVNGHVRRVK